jgi:precorrin-2 dehydrogenase/sirohydrochlorin ferrochelatase
MLIDLRIEGKKVLVIGGGTLGERKAKKLVHHSPEITVISKNFTPDLKELQKKDKLILIKEDIKENPKWLTEQISETDLLYVATDDTQLNQRLSTIAREHKVLVCVVDMPMISDFYSPATFQKGSIRVGICTDGKSPLMSKMLRKRLESVVSDEDSIQVELQSYARKKAHEIIPDSDNRRNALYRVYNNDEIRHLLSQGMLEKAKEIAENVIKQ